MATRASVDDRRLRPPPLQTSIARPSTAPHSGTPTGRRHETPPKLNGVPESRKEPAVAAENTDNHGNSAKSSHQRFVLTDPVAFRYLEEDPATTVLERRKELQGYECYIVEQWTTSRTHPTFVITTYTGDPTHSVVVGVLSVPTDETSWSARLRVYFKALNQYHARRRETPLGILMVTNLSGFPSSLTVIPVPDGDLRKHRFDFFVNENLKRLGCSGRVGLTLLPPSGATIAKFHQLYRTSDKNELYQSVIELVKLCQSALMLFDKLEIDYADGLLCDVTERAINDWWVEIGSEYYNIEPHDGILGPTTVAGLLGLLMGARNRLHAVGAPVAKDPFDVEAMKRGIGTFQKQQRCSRSRRLDRQTLDRLHKSTAKAASSEGWTVPRAVKSTVAELSGKGGEMVADMVGRRDKAGIAEIETCDLERFVQLVYGERCKWLWYGKPMKKAKQESSETHSGPGQSLVFKADEHGGFTWTGRRGTIMDGADVTRHEHYNDLASPLMEQPEDITEDDEPGMRGMLKRATTGLKGDSKPGLGSRVKGAVGLGHQQKPARDEASPSSPIEQQATTHRSRRPNFMRSHTSPTSSPNSPKSPTQAQALDQAIATQKASASPRLQQNRPASYHEPTIVRSQEHPEESKGSLQAPSVTSNKQQDSGDSGKRGDSDKSTVPSETATAEPSIAGSVYNGVELNDVLPMGPEGEQDVSKLLRRTISNSHFVATSLHSREDDFYPRHLSFSLAEASVLTWTSLADEDDEPYYADFKAQLAEEELQAKEAKHLRSAINEVNLETAGWTQEQLRILQGLLTQADRDQEMLERMYHEHMDPVKSLQTNSEALFRDEKERLEEGGKEIETLVAKLEYEINGLKSRVEDVEAGVGDFEKGVGRVEDRVTDLEKEGDKPGWRCVVS